MSCSSSVMRQHIIVIGGGPAGFSAALRAGELGARTTLVTSAGVGGMAAHDGPIPVRTLAHAARLAREAEQFAAYGLRARSPMIDYPKLLARVGAAIDQLHASLRIRERLARMEVELLEDQAARFVDAHVIETASGRRLEADQLIITTGGVSRRLPFRGVEHTATHSDAWSLSAPPSSMIVIGGGDTGIQVASIFAAFGTKVTLLDSSPRILARGDAEVSATVAAALRDRGLAIVEGIAGVEEVAPSGDGMRCTYRNRDRTESVDAAVVVLAVGWVVAADRLGLDAAGVRLDSRGYIATDDCMRTSASHVFAAGDVCGKAMLVSTGMVEGIAAATNAVRDATVEVHHDLMPVGSFSDPEYATVGLTEEAARATREIIVARTPFAELPRAVIDGRTIGFCKLVVDRDSHEVIGAQCVGERAVEIVQVVAAGMQHAVHVEELAVIPFSFPTYIEIVGTCARHATRALGSPAALSAPW
jgi:dihydrolipoamide dehydrogenase